jgi:hypothetical protein
MITNRCIGVFAVALTSCGYTLQHFLGYLTHNAFIWDTHLAAPHFGMLLWQPSVQLCTTSVWISNGPAMPTYGAKARNCMKTSCPGTNFQFLCSFPKLVSDHAIEFTKPR